MGIRCEYIPGRDRMWMSRDKWDEYLRDRLLALVDETGARVMSFDGVVPYPGVIAAKVSHPKLGISLGTTRFMAEEATTFCFRFAITDDGLHR